ncbi:MAG: twin-arginine translocation signal domain-containing protein [Novosphingobium sp.]
MPTPSRRDFLKLATAAGFAAHALPALAEQTGLQAVGGQMAEAARKILQSLPAAREGDGVPIWILSSARCTVCQAMNRKRPGPVPGIATHYLAYPLLDAEAPAVAQVWRARTANAYRRYMAGAFRDAPAFPVQSPVGRSPHHGRADQELSDAELFAKYHAEIMLVKSLWADDSGRIESVTPESYFFLRPPQGPALVRLPGDGIPVLQALMQKYPDWFANT